MNILLKKKFNLTKLEEIIIHIYYMRLLDHFNEGEKALKYADVDGYREVFDDFNTLTRSMVKCIKVDHNEKTKHLTITFTIDETRKQS